MGIQTLVGIQLALALGAKQTSDEIRRDKNVRAIVRTAFLEMPPRTFIWFVQEVRDPEAALEARRLIHHLKQIHEKPLTGQMARMIADDVRYMIRFREWRALLFAAKMGISGLIAIPLWRFRERKLRRRLVEWCAMREHDLATIILEHGSRQMLRTICNSGERCFSHTEYLFFGRRLSAST